MLLATRCAACSQPGPSPCAACHAALRPPAPEPDPPGLEGLVCLLRYDGPARDLVARVKYRNQRQALGWLGQSLADAVIATGAEVDLVTWAPTTVAHRRARGFDHGRLLARAVGRHVQRRARPVLRRAVGGPQTGRAASERRAAGPSFSVVRALPPGTRVLLVDDVVTTGATLAGAAHALRAAGARVVPAALARTPARPGGGAVYDPGFPT